MQLAISLPYAEGATTPAEVSELVRVADSLGYHSVWVAEAWSYDAFVLLASLVPHGERIGLATGIVNVYSRTPAALGQSVAALDAVSGGRAILGLGTSGPQVVQGWHGLPFDRPLARQREVVEIVRAILRRDPLVHHGEVFDLSMGLKLLNHPVRPKVPIALAALGPRNVALTAEVADAWLPVLFSPEQAGEVFGGSLAYGAARRSPDLAPLEIWPSVGVAITEEPEPARTIARHGLALYLGGMGSRAQNFYNALARRYGYESEAATIQDLYLSGKQAEAAAAVPDALLDEVAAIGPRGHVAERFAAFAQAGASVLVLQLLALDQAGRLRALEDLAGLAS